MLIPMIGVILILLGGYILMDRMGWVSQPIQMYERLDADVTMFQRGDRLLPQEEPGISNVI